MDTKVQGLSWKMHTRRSILELIIFILTWICLYTIYTSFNVVECTHYGNLKKIKPNEDFTKNKQQRQNYKSTKFLLVLNYKPFEKLHDEQ